MSKDIWFTADTHFGHKNIIKFDERPFNSIEEHDQALVEYYNEIVKPGDLSFFLGDVCMGFLDDSLAYAAKLNGSKYLIPGNHDRVSHVNKEAYRDKFWSKYTDIFTILPDNVNFLVDEKTTNFSHFPYDGDHMEKERYTEFRMKDDGKTLIHAHTHAKEKVSFSQKGTLQINVGVPAWNWRPVHIDQIIELVKENA